MQVRVRQSVKERGGTEGMGGRTHDRGMEAQRHRATEVRTPATAQRAACHVQPSDTAQQSRMNQCGPRSRPPPDTSVSCSQHASSRSPPSIITHPTCSVCFPSSHLQPGLPLRPPRSLLEVLDGRPAAKPVPPTVQELAHRQALQCAVAQAWGPG